MLIDCNNHLDSSHFLTSELGRSSLTMRKSNIQMKNRKGQVLFQETAANSNNDAAESLVENILSTLKKTSVNLDKRSPSFVTNLELLSERNHLGKYVVCIDLNYSFISIY